MKSAEWYFDFISPFSYLQIEAFGRLPPDVKLTLRPVLFAGLLNHWGRRSRKSGASLIGSYNGLPSGRACR
jgi:2-hydroxychromene-2-carboxylate isomerase